MARLHEQALLGRVSFSGRWQIFGEPPKIAVLLQAMHDVIGNSVALFLCQFLTEATHEFARASQRECDGEAQEIVASTHWKFVDAAFGSI